MGVSQYSASLWRLTNLAVETQKVPFVVTGLFWKPFDARFEDLLDDLRFHQDLVKSEMLLAEMHDTRKARELNRTYLLEVQGRLRTAERVQAAKNKPPSTDADKRAREKQQKGISSMIYAPLRHDRKLRSC